MSGRYVDIDMSEFKAFFGSVEKAAKGDFRKELELFLEGLGNEFLRIVQDEIIRRKVMDTRLLLASFEKDTEGSIWRLEDGGLTLEVGSSVVLSLNFNARTPSRMPHSAHKTIRAIHP